MKENKLSPLDYIKCISNKQYPDELDSYAPWPVNNLMASNLKTLFYANEMNRFYNIPKDLQFDFYYNALPKQFIKISGKGKSDKNLEYKLKLIQDYFKTNRNVALEYYNLSGDSLPKLIEEAYGINGN